MIVPSGMPGTLRANRAINHGGTGLHGHHERRKDDPDLRLMGMVLVAILLAVAILALHLCLTLRYRGNLAMSGIGLQVWVRALLLDGEHAIAQPGWSGGYSNR
jgi:hypothetical protein